VAFPVFKRPHRHIYGRKEKSGTINLYLYHKIERETFLVYSLKVSIMLSNRNLTFFYYHHTFQASMHAWLKTLYKKLELRTNQQIAEPKQQPINMVVESVLRMNPGDGETSYAKNSFLQVSLSLSPPPFSPYSLLHYFIKMWCLSAFSATNYPFFSFLFGRVRTLL